MRLILISALMATALLPVSLAAQVTRDYSADFVGKDGDDHGELSIYDLGQNGVRFVADLKNIRPGTYAVHLHKVSSCLGPDYLSAGDHVAEGLFPNLVVPRIGAAHFDITLKQVTAKALFNDERPYIIDNDGTSLVIDARPEDPNLRNAATEIRMLCAAIQ